MTTAAFASGLALCSELSSKFSPAYSNPRHSRPIRLRQRLLQQKHLPQVLHFAVSFPVNLAPHILIPGTRGQSASDNGCYSRSICLRSCDFAVSFPVNLAPHILIPGTRGQSGSDSGCYSRSICLRSCDFAVSFPVNLSLVCRGCGARRCWNGISLKCPAYSNLFAV